MAWILLAILIAMFIGLLIFIWRVRKKKSAPDFYNVFIIGVIWFIIGMPFRNEILSFLGLMFMIIGLINKKRWKEYHGEVYDLSAEEKRVRLNIIIGIVVLLVVGIVVLLVGK